MPQCSAPPGLPHHHHHHAALAWLVSTLLRGVDSVRARSELAPNGAPGMAGRAEAALRLSGEANRRLWR